MCRVRFGPTGMHFYDLGTEAPQPRIPGARQPSNVALPSTVNKVRPDATPSQLDRGKPQQGNEGASVFGPPGEIVRSDVRWKMNEAPLPGEAGRHSPAAKQVNEQISTRATQWESMRRPSPDSPSYSVSISSSSSSGSPPSSVSSLDNDFYHNSLEKFPYQRLSASAAISDKPQKRSVQPYKHKHHRSTGLKSCLKPNTAPNAKKVRFAMPKQERLLPYDDLSDGSSHSSYESNTDPPLPESAVRPPGFHARCTSKARKEACHVANAATFLESEDGSCMDISEVPAGRTVQRAARPSYKGYQRDADHVGADIDLGYHGRRSEKAVEETHQWDLESIAESNVDDGKGLSTFHGKSIHLRSDGSWDARLRSGELIPEPIFVLRTDSVAYRRKKTSQSLRSRSGRESSVDDTKDQVRESKHSPLGLSYMTKSNRERLKAHRPPTVEDDTVIDVKTGVRFRDV